MEPIIIAINISIFILFFITGYLLGKTSKITIIGNTEQNSKFISEKAKELTTKISIDDKKIVPKMNTENLEKKYESLGDKKVSSDNISNAINKLKEMKK